MKLVLGIFLSVTLLLFCLSLQAQTEEWIWAARAGGTGEDYSHAIATDDQGNQYITGSFEETADFGSTTLTSSGNKDIFVAKLDSDGNWLWAKKAGGTAYDYGQGIVLDGSGNIFVTGYFRDIANFGDISLTSNGYDDIFVAKLSTEVDADDPAVPGLSGNSRLHDAYPNPFSAGGSLTIKADIAANESGTIQIFNLRGQKIAQFELPAGRQQVTLDSSGLSAGVYLYRLKTVSTDFVRKLVLID